MNRMQRNDSGSRLARQKTGKKKPSGWNSDSDENL
jgi:hypothetical protein